MTKIEEFEVPHLIKALSKNSLFELERIGLDGSETLTVQLSESALAGDRFVRGKVIHRSPKA